MKKKEGERDKEDEKLTRSFCTVLSSKEKLALDSAPPLISHWDEMKKKKRKKNMFSFAAIYKLVCIGAPGGGGGICLSVQWRLAICVCNNISFKKQFSFIIHLFYADTNL